MEVFIYVLLIPIALYAVVMIFERMQKSSQRSDVLFYKELTESQGRIISKLKAELSKLSIAVNECKIKNDFLVSQLNNKDKEIVNLNAEIQNRDNKIAEVLKESKLKDKCIDKLQEDLEDNREHIANIMDDISEKDNVIKLYETSNANLQSSLAQARKHERLKENKVNTLSCLVEEKNETIRAIQEKLGKYKEIIESGNPFDCVAHLRAHALEAIGECNPKDIESMAELQKSQYKLEFLLSAFPELRDFKSDSGYINYIQEESERCNILNWISQSEYDILSEVDREQLAVNRYIASSDKSNWEKGRDYEIYVAYRLYNQGYGIEQEGLNKKLKDMGRDIIAKHRDTKKILIVQCKNWNTPIRENVVFQLFGSYAEWLYENNKELFDEAVEPVLYVTRSVSVEAARCAKLLRVRIEVLPIDKFPAIKCNINKNTHEYIYHLPFDRHYDQVRINEKGKGYMFSIKEAMKAGFRRAYNH